LNRRLLLISYVFPPFGGVPVQRALSFAKYLPENGIEVHVLTARNAAAPTHDPALLRQVPESVTIHRTLTPELPFYLRKKLWSLFGSSAPKATTSTVKQFFQPDPQVLWVPFAIRRASRIISKHSITSILVTAPPFSAFLIGIELKRRFPHIQLISDFRDEWLRFYLTDFDFLQGDATRAKAEKIERDTIESSDLVMAVTRNSLAEISRRYPAQPSNKWAWMPNGYDPESIQTFQPAPHNTGRMVVTFMGTTYKTSSPRAYLDAIDSLPEPIRSNIETRFVGRVTDEEAADFQGRKSHIRQYGFLPQNEAYRVAAESDYLLVIIHNDFTLAAKLFEYAAMRKPVLAISPPEGEVGQFVREMNAGTCVSNDDPAALRQMLLTAWERWKQGPLTQHVNTTALETYQRQNVAKQLSERITERPK